MNVTGHDFLVRSSKNGTDEYIGKDHLFRVYVEAELLEFVEVNAREEFFETCWVVLVILPVKVKYKPMILLEFDSSCLFVAMVALLVIVCYRDTLETETLYYL